MLTKLESEKIPIKLHFPINVYLEGEVAGEPCPYIFEVIPVLCDDSGEKIAILMIRFSPKDQQRNFSAVVQTEWHGDEPNILRVQHNFDPDVLGQDTILELLNLIGAHFERPWAQ